MDAPVCQAYPFMFDYKGYGALASPGRLGTVDIGGLDLPRTFRI